MLWTVLRNQLERFSSKAGGDMCEGGVRCAVWQAKADPIAGGIGQVVPSVRLSGKTWSWQCVFRTEN